MSFALDQIPGYREALISAKAENIQTQEDDWLGLSCNIGGIRIRRATLRDYVLMMRYTPSLLLRQLPSKQEVILVLWILSHERVKWDESPSGWRKWLPSFRTLARRRFNRRAEKLLKYYELEYEIQKHETESLEDYELPEDHPFAKAVIALFRYWENINQNSPAGMKNGKKTGMYFLVSWFNTLQRSFHLSTQEIWDMPLPILFARLRENQSFELKGQLPEFNERADELNRKIMNALRNKETTEEDLLSGKFDIFKN